MAPAVGGGRHVLCEGTGRIACVGRRRFPCPCGVVVMMLRHCAPIDFHL